MMIFGMPPNCESAVSHNAFRGKCSIPGFLLMMLQYGHGDTNDGILPPKSSLHDLVEALYAWN